MHRADQQWQDAVTQLLQFGSHPKTLKRVTSRLFKLYPGALDRAFASVHIMRCILQPLGRQTRRALQIRQLSMKMAFEQPTQQELCNVI